MTTNARSDAADSGSLQPPRDRYEKRTLVTFRKEYGESVYHFKYERVEAAGGIWVTSTARKRKIGDSPMRVGELVHFILLEGSE